MSEIKTASRLRLIQEKDVKNKVVLIRVDHNVVKKGKIKDPSRIDSSLGTLFHIVSRGGKPILMTHVGRSRDKKTGEIDCSPDRSINPLVAYLEKKLRIKIETPSFHENHILDIIHSAKTILVNAVMGLVPYFIDGSRALYEAIGGNSSALKLYGGGDTLQELKDLPPGIYLSGLNNPDCYYFTSGGTVLKALEEGSPFKIQPVERLLKS